MMVCNDLRVFAADQVGHRSIIHPLQALYAAVSLLWQDAIEQAGALSVAQRLGQHVAI